MTRTTRELHHPEHLSRALFLFLLQTQLEHGEAASPNRSKPPRTLLTSTLWLKQGPRLCCAASPREQQGELNHGQPQPPSAHAPQHTGSPSISHHHQLRRPKGTLAIKAAQRNAAPDAPEQPEQSRELPSTTACPLPPKSHEPWEQGDTRTRKPRDKEAAPARHIRGAQPFCQHGSAWVTPHLPTALFACRADCIAEPRQAF